VEAWTGESFRLETIGEFHPVASQVFVPFAVTRLQERPEDTEAVLTVALHGIVQQPTEERSFRLFWDQTSIPTAPPAIGEQPLTEWAALGVACAVVWHFAGLRLHAVAAQGDRVDYWVMRDNLEFGLEVSGTISADLQARHQEKVEQLLANPYGADGYVVVVGFAARRLIISFHRNARTSP
jgi:hypothetical protein